MYKDIAHIWKYVLFYINLRVRIGNIHLWHRLRYIFIQKKHIAMKTKILFLMVASVIVFMLPSCVEHLAVMDDVPLEDPTKKSGLNMLSTRAEAVQEDSLAVMSKLQSDVDYLMMSRVLQKDGVFVLAIKREDALFFGISEAVYDHYVDYVNQLNNLASAAK